MDGIHDMGGMQGFGPVPLDKDTIFDHDWQKRAFALAETLAWATPFTADEHRFAIERIPPATYLQVDYFEKWAMAVQTLLLEADLVTPKELETGRMTLPVDTQEHSPVSAAELVSATRAGADMTFDPGARQPIFEVGQTVLTRSHFGPAHTRVPRYVRGQRGRIIANMGLFQFADAMAAKTGPDPHFCYSVEFSAQTLWGPDADPNGTVVLDLWEPYLESS